MVTWTKCSHASAEQWLGSGYVLKSQHQKYSCIGNPMDREPGGLQSLGSKELDTTEVTEHDIAVNNASS